MMTGVFPRLLLLFLLLLLMECEQHAYHCHRIVLQIFDVILYFLFCSFSLRFFFLEDFALFRFFGYYLFSSFILDFFDFVFCLLYYSSFNLIAVLSISYSRGLYGLKNPSLRVKTRIRILLNNRFSRILRFFVWR